MRQIALIVCVLAWASCASDDAAQKPTATPAPPPKTAPSAETVDVVRPTFAWPEGRVKYRRITEETTDGEDPSTTAITFTMVVSKDAAGQTTIAYTDPRKLSMTGLSDEDADAVAPLLGAMTPDVVLDQKGRPIEVIGGDRVRDGMRVMYGDNPQALEAGLAAATDELLVQSAQGELDPLASVWAGRELRLGARYTASVQAIHPFFQVPVKMAIDMGAVKRVPCPDQQKAETTLRCVLFRLERRPDPEDVARASAQWHKGAGAQHDMSLHAAENVIISQLVADPDTLQPYVYEVEKRVTVDMTVAGERKVSSKVEKRTELFSFAPDAS